MRKNKTEISVLPQCSTLRTLLAILSLCLLSISSAGEDVFAGFEAYHRGDYATALKKFRPLAEQGHPKAQYHLGLMYESGRGVVPDKEGSEILSSKSKVIKG